MIRKKFLSMCVHAIMHEGMQSAWEWETDRQIWQLVHQHNA